MIITLAGIRGALALVASDLKESALRVSDLAELSGKSPLAASAFGTFTSGAVPAVPCSGTKAGASVLIGGISPAAAGSMEVSGGEAAIGSPPREPASGPVC